MHLCASAKRQGLPAARARNPKHAQPKTFPPPEKGKKRILPRAKTSSGLCLTMTA
ncbi:hypothetical protein CGMCC3_g9276 [Colletotrichum fructicola]|nr:uncharacterized protein CGMCC3_g9276 [Colletotrichum fructicola]KAE9574736.1 hypothetical protein CGMCC3_g9276 [Colletotrichum fructicola]